MGLSGGSWLSRNTGPLDPLMAAAGGHTLEQGALMLGWGLGAGASRAWSETLPLHGTVS